MTSQAMVAAVVFFSLAGAVHPMRAATTMPELPANVPSTQSSPDAVTRPADPADAPIVALPGDSPAHLYARFGDAAASVRSFSVVAPRDEKLAFAYRSSDLTRTSSEGVSVIDRRNVVVTSTTVVGSTAVELKKGIPTDMLVTVNGAGTNPPGIYEGIIEFYPAARGYNGPCGSLRVCLHVRQTPQLRAVAGADAIDKRITKGGEGSWWTWLFVNDAEFDKNVTVKFEPPGDKLQITGYTVAAKDPAGGVLSDDQIKVGAPLEGTPNDWIKLPITIDANQISSGQYRGSVYLTVPGQAALTAIPLTLTVRVGPGLPLALIFAGVLFGQLHKWAQGSGAARVAMLDRFYQVNSRVSRLSDQDQRRIDSQLQNAREFIYSRKLPDAEQLLAKIEVRIDTLVRLVMIDGMVGTWPDGDKKDDANRKIETIRDAIAMGDDQSATKQLDDLQKALDAYRAGAQSPSGKVGGDLRESATAMRKVAANNVMWRPWRILRGLPGYASALQSESVIWILRPVMWSLTLLVLVIVGMRLYYGTGAFGSDAAANMVAALVYGFSADALSRTLTNNIQPK